jgi:hypothetical protein
MCAWWSVQLRARSQLDSTHSPHTLCPTTPTRHDDTTQGRRAVAPRAPASPLAHSCGWGPRTTPTSESTRSSPSLMASHADHPLNNATPVLSVHRRSGSGSGAVVCVGEWVNVRGACACHDSCELVPFVMSHVRVTVAPPGCPAPVCCLWLSHSVVVLWVPNRVLSPVGLHTSYGS